MAYIGSDPYLASWYVGRLAEDMLAESCIFLLGQGEAEAECEPQAGDASQGYIIRDWFGPFLLGPASCYLRGRC